jgi:UDP-glucose 4-epimerase
VLNRGTRFICVRYGNVLASRGSVIPLFLDQIRNGGPVTVTVPGMTRFLLSLDQAVDTVFVALREAHAGETYVPRAPSATVDNIARALIGERAVSVEVVGIRPGEKMHEIMVSEEEAHHCAHRGDYYAILPMLPELRREGPSGPPALTAEYSSADDVLDLEATRALLRRHRLMPEDAAGEQRELLR